MSGARLNIFPTRMCVPAALFCLFAWPRSDICFARFRALTTVKLRLKGAKTGYSLLKKKSDALTVKFRMVTKKIMDNKRLMGSVLQEAHFSYAQVFYVAGDVGCA